MVKVTPYRVDPITIVQARTQHEELRAFFIRLCSPGISLGILGMVPSKVAHQPSFVQAPTQQELKFSILLYRPDYEKHAARPGSLPAGSNPLST